MTEKLKILPLGGLREVGKNCMLLIYGKNALMVDCGMGFPGSDDFLDDDFFIPDFDVIEDLNITIQGVVVTHGHEDHIGGIPYLLQRFDIPVYMTDFPSHLISERMSKVAKYNNINTISGKKPKPINIGPFTVTFIDVCHSIPESKGLLIEVGSYKLVFTGDFKFYNHNQSPFKDTLPDNIDILFIDSTNVEQTGRTKDESSVVENIRKIISSAQGRVIATAFSSNITRIKNIIDLSIAQGRTVGLLGRSVNQYTSIAEKLGYIKLPPSILTNKSDMSKVPDNKLTLIVTGSQAEPRSIMKRMSLDMLKSVTVKYGDTIFFSSKMIPGNEISIGRMLDSLVEKGVNLYYENTADIHVSGHARQDDLIQAVHDVNPRLVIPVHGHIRFLDLQAKLAEQNGYTSRLISDGDLLIYTKKDNYLHQKIDLEPRIVSNYNPRLLDIETVKERRRLARSGFMSVMMHVDFMKNVLIVPPRLFSYGIASQQRIKKIEREIKEIIYDYFSTELNDTPEWEEVEEDIRILTRRYLAKLTNKKPIVFSTIVNLD